MSSDLTKKDLITDNYRLRQRVNALERKVRRMTERIPFWKRYLLKSQRAIRAFLEE